MKVLEKLEDTPSLWIYYTENIMWIKDKRNDRKVRIVVYLEIDKD